jgi:hypothetical protein
VTSRFSNSFARLIGVVLAFTLLSGACSSSEPNPELTAALAALKEAEKALEAHEAALEELAATPATTTPATTTPATTTPATTTPATTTPATTTPATTTEAPEEPPCPPILPVPDEAIINASVFSDLDGDGIDEEVFTWILPGGDQWHLRVIDGVDQAGHQISDSHGVYLSEILGVLYIDDDTIQELFVTVTGGAYTTAFGVFQYHDCEIIRTTTVDGPPAVWHFGASISNVLQVVCDPEMPFIRTYTATISESSDDGYPLIWSVHMTREGLWESQWEPVGMSAGGDYEADGPEPPISGDLDCGFE